MNFQDRTQGVGVPCVLRPSWPPPPSSRSLSGRGDCQYLRSSVAGHRSAFSLLASDVGRKLGLCLLMLSFMFWASPKSPTILRAKFVQSLTCMVNSGGPEHPLLSCRDPPPSGAPGPPLWSGLPGHHCSASCCPGSEHSQPLQSCPGWGAAVSL